MLEVQLLLQPQFENLGASSVKIVRFCAAQQGDNADACSRAFNNVKRSVLDKSRKAIRAIAQRTLLVDVEQCALDADGEAQSAFSEDLLTFFGSAVGAAPTRGLNEG